MKNIYIYQPSRLGDMIICNGLIRILSKKNNTSYLNIFCRSSYLKLIKFMYRDHKSIKLIPFNEHPKLTDEKGCENQTWIDTVGYQHLTWIQSVFASQAW